MNTTEINAESYEKVLLFRNLSNICDKIQNTYNLPNYKEMVYTWLEFNTPDFTFGKFIDIGNIIYDIDASSIIGKIENLEISDIGKFLQKSDTYEFSQKFGISVYELYIALLIKIFKIDSEFYVYVS